MDRPIERIEPERILPTGRYPRDRSRDGEEKKFSLSKEADEPEEEQADDRPPQDRTVGPRAEDEAGGNLDVTA